MSVFYLARVSLSLIVSFVLLALTLTYRISMVSKSWKLRFDVCHKRIKWIHSFDKNPTTRRFCREKHEIQSPAWSGTATEGLASRSDCHKAAKIVSYEDAL
jgi:hypothetical protein